MVEWEDIPEDVHRLEDYENWDVGVIMSIAQRKYKIQHSESLTTN